MNAKDAAALVTSGSADVYEKTYEELMDAITFAARSGSASIKISALKTLSPSLCEKLYTRLRGDGYKVTESTLPDSKIEPNRLIVTITWAA